nr:hypothetical protein [Tianweitania populi]
MVAVEIVEFKWHAGLSIAQKQRSVEELHAAARAVLKVRSVLEVSSKSRDRLGVALSAFNLTFGSPPLTVECAFQGSKVFRDGGPFNDLFSKVPREAKRDQRLRNSGPLTSFVFDGRQWPTEPKTVFYDWIYVSALQRHHDLADGVRKYDAFTDIEFNPEKSFNCQARSVALYVSLLQSGLLEQATSSPDAFLELFGKPALPSPQAAKQGELF